MAINQVRVQEFLNFDQFSVAHWTLGIMAEFNAFLPLLVYQYLLKVSDGFIGHSTYSIMWKIFYITYLFAWIVPALLFPFTFFGIEVVNLIFTEAIDTYLIVMPFTFYWAMLLGFIITAIYHIPSVKEPLSEVYTVLSSYMIFAGISTYVQLSQHGTLIDWYQNETSKT